MKPTIRKTLRAVIVLLVLSCFLVTLCGCPFFSGHRGNGLPDFPDSKWVCREADLVIYMIEGCDMCGTYTVNGNEYRAVAYFYNDAPGIYIQLYSAAEETASEYDPDLIHRSDKAAGSIGAWVEYYEDTGLLVCTGVSYTPVDGETIPDTLTFEQTGTFAPTPKTRWVAEGLDLYLDSYSDAEWYFKGEITLDGEKQAVQAIEIGNDHYYALRYTKDEPRVLLYLSFDISEDRIVATASDDFRYNDDYYRIQYSAWYRNYKDVKTITFHPTPLE